jgi:hypothetical protein
VKLDEAFRERESQSGALARSFAANLAELLEDLLLILGATPIPVSRTSTRTSPLSARTFTSMRPPSGVNFTALLSRL